MTKEGFKSVTIPDSLYRVLSLTAKINKISISKAIEKGVLGGLPYALNPTAVGSNPSQPAIDFSNTIRTENHDSIDTFKP